MNVVFATVIGVLFSTLIQLTFHASMTEGFIVYLAAYSACLLTIKEREQMIIKRKERDE